MRRTGSTTALRWAAWGTGVTALLHVAIIIGGPDWYRFFGAGEGMARLAARGSLYPAVLTSGIAAVLGVAALYGLSGAGLVRPLPALRPVLRLLAAVFLARGVLGVPVVLLGSGSYILELRSRPVFMVVTSLVCLALGLAYGAGAGRSARAPVVLRDAPLRRTS